MHLLAAIKTKTMRSLSIYIRVIAKKLFYAAFHNIIQFASILNFDDFRNGVCRRICVQLHFTGATAAIKFLRYVQNSSIKIKKRNPSSVRSFIR